MDLIAFDEYAIDASRIFFARRTESTNYSPAIIQMWAITPANQSWDAPYASVDDPSGDIWVFLSGENGALAGWHLIAVQGGSDLLIDLSRISHGRRDSDGSAVVTFFTGDDRACNVKLTKAEADRLFGYHFRNVGPGSRAARTKNQP